MAILMFPGWYIKLNLMDGDKGHRVKKRKTTVQYCKFDPVFNDRFAFLTVKTKSLIEVSGVQS